MAAGVRPLVEGDLLEACETLALAFDDDPFYRFLLPDPKDRRRWLEVIMALAIHEALPDGAVRVPDEGAGVGAVILNPPGCYPAPWRRRFGFLIRRLPRPEIPAPPLSLLRFGPGALAAARRVHLSEPHYYLPVIGVHPRAHGRGLGRRLLEAAIEMAAQARVPLYLETTRPDNLGFYRRFGFTLSAEVSSRRGAPPIWTMVWRPAAGD